ncbi:hypothetical protein ACI8AF_14390 [Blastococcus sp. SYSU D00669]
MLVVALATALAVVLIPSPSPQAEDAVTAQAESPTEAPAASSGPEDRDIIVNFLLEDAKSAAAGCIGQGGYSDIGPGTPVTIKSGTGEILGAGSLGRGSNASGVNCLWSVIVRDVRLGEAFYSAEVGSRGAITYSQAELAGNGYEFDLSLG